MNALKAFDFDRPVPRRGTASVKWDDDPREGQLPMWVADMDFRTAPCILAALRRRVEHGIFGYALPPESYYEAVRTWFLRRHGWAPEREWILPTTGVIPALAAILHALTRPGDRILMQTPVYNHFFIAVENAGCTVDESPLILHDNTYRIDFEDLERRAADPRTKLMLLCNPHNPAGRVWSPEELRRIGEICLRHDLFILSDEIHCELVMPGFRHTTFASLGDEFLRRSVTCCSPSKAFNLAGLQVANIFAADPEIRTRITRALEVAETGSISPFAIDALTAAYNEGETWLDALIGYLHANDRYLREFMRRELPRYAVLPLEGTYLEWIDCRHTGLRSEDLAARLQDESGLRVNPGSIYGAAGEGFLRLNIACPRVTLTDGLERLKHTLQNIDR